MEKGTEILIGVGCGCASLVGLGAAAFGAYFLLADTSTSGPIGGPVAIVEEVTGEPRDAALASFVNAKANEIVAAARMDPQASSELTASVGPNAQIFMTVLELEATDGSSRVRSNAAVFPDGRVRWAMVNRDTVSTTPTAGLASAAPALDGAVRRMLETLGGSCDLPVMGASDVAPLPAEPREDILRGVSNIPQACLPGLGGPAWQPKVDDVTVALQGNGRWAMVRSSFDVSGGTLRHGGHHRVEGRAGRRAAGQGGLGPQGDRPHLVHAGPRAAERRGPRADGAVLRALERLHRHGGRVRDQRHPSRSTRPPTRSTRT